MRKYIVASIFVVGLFVVAAPVAAQQDRMTPKRATVSAELKQKFANFVDKNKAQIADRLDTNLNTVNKNRTGALNNQLAQMRNIAARVQNRIASASAAGKNTASASASLTTAQTAITTAQTAVTAQAAKDYSITITSEASIRADIKKVRDQLFADLKATHQLVKAAKQALVVAVQETVKLGM